MILNNPTEGSIGTFYANEPIIVSVQLQRPANTEDISMLQAVVQLRNDRFDSDAPAYEFAVGAEWGDTVDFDVSTAFRAELARKNTPSPETDESGNGFFGGMPINDNVTLFIAYGCRYLYQGESTEDSQISKTNASATAWRGGRSDTERLLGIMPDPTVFKTTNPEHLDETMCGWYGIPESYASRGYVIPRSTKPVGDQEWETVNVGDTMRLGIFNGVANEANNHREYTSKQFGHKIYVEKNPLRYNFMFLNHLGFIESASCMMRENKSYQINSTNFFRTYAPTTDVKPTLYSTPTGNRAVWKMSSGFVTRAWAEWFATEFLMSSRHWMSINGIWMPVSITPDSDSVTVYDESKGEIAAINFTVTSSIKGRI